MNEVMLSGNLFSAPERLNKQSSVSGATFRLAVQRKYKDKATGRRESDFFNITVWRQQADFMLQHAEKGDKVTVIGSIHNRSYEKDGVKHWVTEIVADSVELYKKRDQTAQSGGMMEVDDPENPF